VQGGADQARRRSVRKAGDVNQPRFLFPQRWSREKRKAKRVLAIAAWRWEQMRAALRVCLDRVWGDNITEPFTWESSGFVAGTFVDDAEAAT
jgi:hypothetical protein